MSIPAAKASLYDIPLSRASFPLVQVHPVTGSVITLRHSADCPQYGSVDWRLEK